MKILVLCLPGIGDGLMATPMIKLLRKKYPDTRIDVATMFEGVHYIFEHNPYITASYNLHLYKQDAKRGLQQLLKLRKEHYDISFLAFPAYRREYHIVQWLIGAKRRIAHRFNIGYWKECNFLDTDLVSVDEKVHNVINNLQLLDKVGIYWQRETKNESIQYDLKIPKEDEAYGKAYIKSIGWDMKNIIGIHPGSTDSKAAILRRWPIERYSMVAGRLIKKKKNILIFVGPDEKQLGEKLSVLINNPSHCMLVKGDFRQAVGVLNTVDLLLCNDNGFGHLAIALNKPIITLWASTNDIWSLPYSKELVTLIRPKRYKPWYRYDLKRGVPAMAKNGMLDIEVSEVEQTLKHMRLL